MKTKTVFTILLLHLLVGCAAVSWRPYFKNYEIKMGQGNERFLVNAKINGKPVSLALDTGSEGELDLFSPAAERVGVKFPATAPGLGDATGKTLVHRTEPLPVEIFNANCRIPLYVAHVPVAVDVDGLVGWELIADNITQIDVAGRSARFLDKIPAEVRHWTKLRLSRTSNVLALDIPGPHGNETLLIDTGNDGGVSLNPERWKEWTRAHPDRPKTLQLYYMGGSGIVAGEESWARQLSLGPLSLTGVPVSQASLTEQRMATNYAATLGLVALERLDLIVDGKAGAAYVRPRQGPFRPVPYNRAGMVFVPIDPSNSIKGESKAVVLEGGPAYQAGIRDGDMPLKLGNQWRTNWTTTPTFLARKLPAGSKMELTLERGKKTFTTEVVLRDLFPPAASGSHQ